MIFVDAVLVVMMEDEDHMDETEAQSVCFLLGDTKQTRATRPR